jgi:RND family efflux transporter MFP subunit
MTFHYTSKKLLPVIILVALLALTALVLLNPPQTDHRTPDDTPRISVETLTLQPGHFRAAIVSYGTIEPTVQSMLVSQVSGMIVGVSPQFRDGGFFKKGDILLSIDDRDYRADVSIAEANLLDARQRLAEEKAQSEQAQADWLRLGNEGPAPDLVLRKPQLLAAQANLKSAEAALAKTQLSLERTRIKAPFDGRIRAKQVDLGQVVSINTSLAEIYASDAVEVRLPLCNCDLEMVNLPENRGEDSPQTIAVTLNSSLTEGRQWSGEIVRTEAAIDDSSRQLHVVAQIDNPFTGGTPVKIGEYVSASIRGKSLSNTLVIPTTTIYQGSHVYTVDNGFLMRKEIEIRWQNSEFAIVDNGLQAGDQLVLTPLGQVTSGTRVTVTNAGQESTPPSSATDKEASSR